MWTRGVLNKTINHHQNGGKETVLTQTFEYAVFLHNVHNVIHIWCTGTLKLETLMCDEEKNVSESHVEKGVMLILCMQDCCV